MSVPRHVSQSALDVIIVRAKALQHEERVTSKHYHAARVLTMLVRAVKWDADIMSCCDDIESVFPTPSPVKETCLTVGDHFFLIRRLSSLIDSATKFRDEAKNIV
jgi:hypothetical protein